MSALPRLFLAPALALSLALTAAPPVRAGGEQAMIESAVAAESVAKGKQTKAGLYVTAAEAAQLLAARDDVVLIDVRTPEETMLVGYPGAADVNIPFRLIDPNHPLNARKGSYGMVPNPGFVEGVTRFLDGTAPAAVLVMCRSGGRSAAAVDALIAAGVELPLYSVVDGFEGDADDSGKRVVNGWKNSGAAWGYKLREGYLQGVE